MQTVALSHKQDKPALQQVDVSESYRPTDWEWPKVDHLVPDLASSSDPLLSLIRATVPDLEKTRIWTLTITLALWTSLKLPVSLAG